MRPCVRGRLGARSLFIASSLLPEPWLLYMRMRFLFVVKGKERLFHLPSTLYLAIASASYLICMRFPLRVFEAFRGGGILVE